MSKRDEKRHRYAQLMLAHRQEWQRYAHNQTKRAIRKDKSAIRTAFASTSSTDAAIKKIEAYHKGPSIKIWENVFKAVWLETGHAAAEFMHEYLTGKSVNLTADIQHKGEGIRTLVWKDPVVDTVLSSWDSRVDDKIMNGGFLDKIEGINSTTQDKIHSTIQEGIANGDSHYTIGQNIEGHLDETWAKRGETISRTETNSAMNAATREDMKATAPDLWKTWSIAGNNTRPWHEEVDGESIPQDEMFIVDGEEMDGPGDDSASPGNVINCECTQLAEEPPAGTPVSDEEQARVDEAALAEAAGETPAALDDMTSSELIKWNEENGVFRSIDGRLAEQMDADVLKEYLQTTQTYLENNTTNITERDLALMFNKNSNTASGGIGGITLSKENITREAVNNRYDILNIISGENNVEMSAVRFAKEDQAKITNIHELGHIFQYDMGYKPRAEFDTIFGALSKEEQKNISVYSLTKYTGGLTQNYGKYSEGFSESQVLYVTGHADLLPKSVVDFFKASGLIEGSLPLELI